MLQQEKPLGEQLREAANIISRVYETIQGKEPNPQTIPFDANYLTLNALNAYAAQCKQLKEQSPDDLIKDYWKRQEDEATAQARTLRKGFIKPKTNP